MISVDTNILVRYFINDDLKQYQIVKDVFNVKNQIFVTKSVLLECYWVLINFYGFDKSGVIDAYIRLYYLENITFEEHSSIFEIFAACKKGLDFADAMHLYSSV